MYPYGYYSSKKLKMMGLGIVFFIFWHFRWWILLFGIILLLLYIYLKSEKKRKQVYSFASNRISPASQSLSQKNKNTYAPEIIDRRFNHEEVKEIVYQTIKAEPETNLYIEDLSKILGFNKKEIKNAINELSQEGCIRLGEKGFCPVYSE